MASGFKSGGEGNVDSGPGTKSGKGSGGGGKVAKVEKQHDVEFAQGGDTHMFGPQGAGPQKPGGTAHKPSSEQAHGTQDTQSMNANEFGKGGTTKMFSYNPSVPATAGITSAR